MMSDSDCSCYTGSEQVQPETIVELLSVMNCIAS